jgi:hypothetical protein
VRRRHVAPGDFLEAEEIGFAGGLAALDSSFE